MAINGLKEMEIDFVLLTIKNIIKHNIIAPV